MDKVLVEEYLSLTVEERQSHLDLDSPCNERGGNSTNHRGVLAQYLNTPIYGKPADLCHACSNNKCSNPKHLYWGTRSENVMDGMKNGTVKTPWDYLTEKHNYKKAREIISSNLDPSAGGRGNKGIPKSEEHKRKIRETLKKRLSAGTGIQNRLKICRPNGIESSNLS